MNEFTAKPIWINWLEKIQIIENNLEIISQKDCLYQAYGDSPIYGRDALLYIGKTNDLPSRTEKHLNTDFSRINNLSIVVGNINFNYVRTYIELTNDKILRLTEALLITMLKPSYNSSNIKDTSGLLKNGEKYIIMNAGNRCALPLEITNIWWGTENNNTPSC